MSQTVVSISNSLIGTFIKQRVRILLRTLYSHRAVYMTCQLNRQTRYACFHGGYKTGYDMTL